KANWCRVRKPRRAFGTSALSSRAFSCVHSLGKSSRVSTRVWPLRETSPKEMATGQGSTWPSRPHHCRAPPTDSRPDFGNPEGSHPNTPSAWPTWVLTWLINPGRNGSSSHASQPMKPCRGRRDWPKRYAIAAIFLRSTSDHRPHTEVLACCSAACPWQLVTKGFMKG